MLVAKIGKRHNADNDNSNTSKIAPCMENSTKKLAVRLASAQKNRPKSFGEENVSPHSLSHPFTVILAFRIRVTTGGETDTPKATLGGNSQIIRLLC